MAQSKLEAIYNAYSDAMYYRAYAVLKNRQDAEDAVHTAFVKLSEHMAKLSEPLSRRTRSFALIVAENAAIDIYRKKRKCREVELEEEWVETAAYEYEGSNEVAAQILKLPVKLRNVLLLKYVHGYHYAEIGEIMGITGEDAKKTGQRAKAKLEELCREEGIL